MPLTELVFVLDREWAETIVDVDDRPVTRREFEEWDDFAREVADAAGLTSPVRVTDGWPTTIPGQLLLAPVGAVLRLADRGHQPEPHYSRTILIGTTDSPREARRLDGLGVAGAIADVQYTAWRQQRKDCLPIGLLGLRMVGARFRARCESTFMATERYCILDAEGQLLSFPELVGVYAREYAVALLDPVSGSGGRPGGAPSV